MMTFINSRDDATTKNLVEVDDNVDIYDTFEAFVGFLQACTYNNSVIYHGLVEAVAKMEEVMECDAGTYKDEILEHMEPTSIYKAPCPHNIDKVGADDV